MMANDGISVADALALRNSGSNDDGWGGSNGWWIIILILFIACGGWGRNGWGNNGGDNGGNPCCVPATAQGMTDAFNFNQLDNGIRGIQNGICDGFYATQNAINSTNANIQNCYCQTQLNTERGFNGVNQSISNLGYEVQNGFCGVDKAILQSDFHNQNGFNAITNQLASCCCDLSRGQESIKSSITSAANELLVAGDRNTDRIINYLTQNEMDRLRTELSLAQSQLSQNLQTDTIVNRLLPVAKPAYITCSPYASAFGMPNTCGCA